MALGRLGSRSRKFVPPKLMITSLMDMFTIILIFLLFSFSNNPEKMQLDQNMDLPKSSSRNAYTDTIKIVLTKETLRLEDEIVGTVEQDRILGLDSDKLKESVLFGKLMERNETIGMSAEDHEKNKEKHILFLCDKAHSFKTINDVIKTAGLAGFPNFQFAVIEEKQ